MKVILGISAFYHDSAAALVVDGVVVAAAQEERFTRKKHDASFPTQAIKFCLEFSGLEIEDIDHVAFYEKPFLKFERILETSLRNAPRGLGSFCTSMPIWLRTKLYISRIIRRELGGQFKKRIIFPEHHESHAASAFFPSPFNEAAILTMDGVGEWATTTLGIGCGNRIELKKQMVFPDSLGLLYSAFTYHCGFRVNGGEGKLMGLAPYGEPEYVDLILDRVVDLKDDGSFQIDQSWFDYSAGSKMTSSQFDRHFGGPPNEPESEITDRERNLAASIQQVTELITLKVANFWAKESEQRNLCIAGGVGLNCVANGMLLRESPFDNVWVQPAAGDSGGAVGSALFVWHQLLENERSPSTYSSPFIGPSFHAEVESELRRLGRTFEWFESDDELLNATSSQLENGKIVGWFQGRMEFGPRALGSRSILASPVRAEMKSRLNNRVKHREPFRPFAPVVLADQCSEYFDLDSESPYMLIATMVKDEAKPKIPAVTHVDGTARVQTVNAAQNGRLHALLQRFHSATGCAALINTSFNVRGEPIVCSVEDAVRCFMNTELDALVIDNALLLKTEQTRRVLPARNSQESKKTSFVRAVAGWLQWATFPIRWLVSRVVLAIIFFVVVTPIGLAMRLAKSDDRIASKSYWIESSERPDKKNYFKQY